MPSGKQIQKKTFMNFLLFAVTASSLILISFKIFEKLGIDSFTAITINYIVGAAFGYNYIDWEVSATGVISSNWFPMAALTGLALIVSFVLFSLSAQKAGIAITAISSRMAVITSVLFGIFHFGDNAGIVKISGIALAIVAFYLTFRKEKADRPSLFLLLLPLSVFILMGLNDIILKVTQFYYIGDSNTTEQTRYAATAFLFGFLIGIPALIYRYFAHKKSVNIKDVGAGIILGLLNWFSTYYLLRGLAVMEVSLFIPLLNISVVTISALVGFFIFREKLSLVNKIGILTAIFAIILIARG
jgi:drug/metabolite transporter (DMT)-like permease